MTLELFKYRTHFSDQFLKTSNAICFLGFCNAYLEFEHGALAEVDFPHKCPSVCISHLSLLCDLIIRHLLDIYQRKIYFRKLCFKFLRMK